MSKEPKPWAQQPKEPDSSYRLFVLYRDMTKRSLPMLAKLLGHNTHRSLEQASSTWQWQRRVAAWDAEVGRRAMASQVDDVVTMRKRHIQIGVGMQTAAIKELQALVHKIEAAADDAKQRAVREGRDPAKAYHEPVLSVAELVRLSEHGTTLERLSRGEPTEVTQEVVSEDAGLERLNVEQLRQLKRLKSLMAGGPGDAT